MTESKLPEHVDLLKMAKEAGFKTADFPGAIHARDDYGTFAVGDLLQFAALVHQAAVIATAEECAKVCDDHAEKWPGANGHRCAQAIRTKYTSVSTPKAQCNADS